MAVYYYMGRSKNVRTILCACFKQQPRIARFLAFCCACALQIFYYYAVVCCLYSNNNVCSHTLILLSNLTRLKIQMVAGEEVSLGIASHTLCCDSYSLPNKEVV